MSDTFSLYFSPSNLRVIAVLLLGYFVTGELGVMLATPHAATPVWLPAGISLAAIMLRGRQVWPGIFLGALAANMTLGMPPGALLAIAVGNTLCALLASYLVDRFAHGIDAFFEAANVVRFVFCAGIFSTALCATLGAFALCVSGFTNWPEFRHVWFLWWTGDLLGILLITPFLVLLLGHRHHPLQSTELVEMTVLLAGLSVVCVLNFGPADASRIPGSGLHYLCVPFLAWAAIRFCPLEAAGATLVLGSFAMWGSLHGYGLFAKTSGAPYIGAGYVAVICATTLAIAAVFREQKKDLEDALGAYCIMREKYEREALENKCTTAEAAHSGE